MLTVGDAIRFLERLPEQSADAVITDPPYSSGGFTRSDRNQTPASKYVSSGTVIQRPSFSGDNRDGRSWYRWCLEWMGEALKATREGGYLLTFTDWRQLPLTTDAVQGAGWIWRGVISWDKGRAARGPNKAYFRHQCEYVVWGTRGTTDPSRVPDGPLPGAYQIPINRADKHHITGKPVELMRELVKIVPPGGLVVDPFAGSGTTGVAALERGRRFLGCELSKTYAEIARCRMRDCARGAAPRTGDGE